MRRADCLLLLRPGLGVLLPLPAGLAAFPAQASGLTLLLPAPSTHWDDWVSLFFQDSVGETEQGKIHQCNTLLGFWFLKG